MKITLTQSQPSLAIGATAVLRVDLAAAAAAPFDSASLIGVAGGAFRPVALGTGLVLTSGTLAVLGGGGGGGAIGPATTKSLGVVIVGANLQVAGDGTISLAKAGVIGALGYTPVDSAGALAAAPVQSVAGRTGVITLGTADISGFNAAAAAAAPVQSVAGRTGAVTLAAADVSGLAASATTDTTNAANISSGTLPVARLPLGTGAAAGALQVGTNLTVAAGVVSLTNGNVIGALGFTPVSAAGAAAAAPVQTVAGRTGAVTLAAADISGLAASATTDTTNAANIGSGTLPVARLPLGTGAAVGALQVGTNLTVAAGVISLTKANVTGALGLTPVDAAGASAAAPVQSVGGATGAVTLPYGMTVDFSQGVVPTTGTITLDGALTGGTTITDAVHGIGTAGGSMTWRLQIVNGGTPTNITGLNAVTTNASSMTTTAATAANKGVAGDQLQLVITAVTGTPAGASITIRGTRP